MNEEIVKVTDIHGSEANEVEVVDSEGGWEVGEEMASDEKGVGEGVGTQNELAGDSEPQSFTIEVVPHSPTSSVFLSDLDFPPHSDGGIEPMAIDNPMFSEDEGTDWTTSSTAKANPPHGFTKELKRRKRSGDGGGKHEPIRGQPKRMKMSDDEDGGLSRSAAGSRKIKEALKSGTFVVDEKKRGRFEEKCRGLDQHAQFCYGKSWQVRHSRCSKWVKMQEPYNTVRFGEHVDGCKHTGKDTRDGTIDMFFKPRSSSKTGTVRMAKPSARREIFTMATSRQKVAPINPDLPPIPFITNERPCLGLEKDQDERINQYISRAVVEGAGSCSETNVAKNLFGSQVKYSELDDTSKRYVTAAQVHEQKWKISYTLGSIFSADCREKIAQGSTCDKCLDLLHLDAFRKTLNTRPSSLENLKFTPHRHRNAATNLGINLARIEGVSELLEKVSIHNFCCSSSAVTYSQESKDSVWVRFAIDAINGKYDDNRVFLGLIEAMAGKADRREQNVGNQNFQYPKGVVDFSQLIMTISPQSYRYMQSQLQLPSVRHLQFAHPTIPYLDQPF